jgi:CTP synthase
VQIVELPSHPYFVGAQFHPEFKSRPGKPSALFLGLIAAASGCLESVLQTGGKVNIVSKNGVANGSAMGKVHQNGNVYSNGNGLHH